MARVDTLKVLDALGSPTLMLDEQGRIQHWNPQVAALTGLSAAEVIGTSFVTQCIYDEDQERVQSAVDAAFDNKLESRPEGARLLNKGSELSEVMLNFGCLKGAEGSSLLVTIEDISALAAQLREAHWVAESLARLVDEANAFSVAIDEDGRVVEWNQRAAEVAGFGQTQAQPHFLELVAESCQGQVEAALEQIRAGSRGCVLQLELQAQHPELEQSCAEGASENGHLAEVVPMTLIAGLSPRYGKDNQVLGALCIGQIVPRGLAGPAIEHAMLVGKDASAQAKKLVMRELRAPLHGIIGLAFSLAQDEGPLHEPLKMIHHSAQRVLEIATSLVDYWALAIGATEIVAEELNLAKLVQEVVQECLGLRDKRGKPICRDSVRLVEAIVDDLPPIEGDQETLWQLFYHLLVNAFKFTSRGHVKVMVTSSHKGKGVEVAIEDTGAGISHANLKSIFLPYYQEETTENRRAGGIGLGLAICKEVAKLHKGRISVDSIRGRGSTFRVVLPCRFGEELEPLESRQASMSTCGDSNAFAVGSASSFASTRSNHVSGSNDSGTSMLPLSDVLAAQMSMPSSSSVPAQRQWVMPPSAGKVTSQPGVWRPLIMVVDHDSATHDIIRTALQPWGHRFLSILSSVEFLEYFERNEERPDLVLLELMMPGFSGFDILEEYRKRWSDDQLAIIMMSEKKITSAVVRALELGCSDWISKPFENEELVARIRTQLRIKGMLDRTHLRQQELAGASTVRQALGPTVSATLQSLPTLSMAELPPVTVMKSLQEEKPVPALQVLPKARGTPPAAATPKPVVSLPAPARPAIAAVVSPSAESVPDVMTPSDISAKADRQADSKLSLELRQAQEKLAFTQGQLHTLDDQLKSKEQQLETLRAQLEDAKTKHTSAATAAVELRVMVRQQAAQISNLASRVSSSNGSSSENLSVHGLALQWQNTQLHASVKHYREQLAYTERQLQLTKTSRPFRSTASLHNPHPLDPALGSLAGLIPDLQGFGLLPTEMSDLPPPVSGVSTFNTASPLGPGSFRWRMGSEAAMPHQYLGHSQCAGASAGLVASGNTEFGLGPLAAAGVGLKIGMGYSSPPSPFT